MKTAFPLALLSVAVCMPNDPRPLRRRSRSYPRVYGPTGRLYGPTQAEYQYQRQYGRPVVRLRAAFRGSSVGYANGYP